MRWLPANVLELRVYQMVLTGGTARVWKTYTFYGAQAADDAIFISDPVSNEPHRRPVAALLLKQTFGTGRSFPWKVLKHN